MHSIGLGIIGCGIAARELHLPALRGLRSVFRITAVCNHTAPKAKSFAALVGGVPYVLDYRELLRRGDVDAVDIVLPIDLNCRVALDALKAGKHVFLEKPIAATLAEGRRMLAAARRSRCVTMVAENFRYQASFGCVKKVLARGIIGRPYAVVWNIFQVIGRDNPYAKTAWRIHHKYPGGFITDAGVHNAAALRDLFGGLTARDAHTGCVNHRIGKMDTFIMRWSAPGAVAGTLNIFFSASGMSRNEMLIFGRKGTIEVRESEITVFREDRRPRRISARDDGGYCAEFLDFARAIRTGRNPLSTFEEGYRDLKVILDAIGTSRREEGGGREKRANHGTETLPVMLLGVRK